MTGPRLDPVTAEVIGNSFVSTADEMLAALIKSAYSTNIKERQDCSSVVMDSKGGVVCIGDISQPIHISSFMFTGGAILERFPPDALREGDVFMVNDPYSGGPSHLADVTFVGPVFHRGRFLGFVGNTGHWPDVGGKAPGQCALGDSTEIFQEAIRFPPLRILRAGELEREVLEMVLLNVRDPDSRDGDIRAQIGSVHLGVRRMQELADRHGAQVLGLAMEESHRVSEAKIRHGILQLREGSFEAVDYMDDDMDSDEPIPMKVSITVRHRPQPAISLDFSGTGGPARWGVNCPYSATAAMVGWVLRSVLDPTALASAGFWRAVEMNVPRGCLLNAVPPSPVGARSEVCAVLPDMLLAALQPAVEEQVVAGSHGVHGMGFSSRRSPSFIYYETVAGGGGARETKDGIDGIWETSNLPIEAMESEFPMMADMLEYVPDSAGPGRFRGGVGVRKEYRLLVDAYVATHSNRHTVAAPGLMGAGDGATTSIVHNPTSPESGAGRSTSSRGPVELPREGTFIPVDGQDVVAIVSGGGGGFGDPLDRPPDLVLWDVLNGKVTREGARQGYGVVIEGYGAAPRLDLGATEQLRREMWAAR